MTPRDMTVIPQRMLFFPCRLMDQSAPWCRWVRSRQPDGKIGFAWVNRSVYYAWVPRVWRSRLDVRVSNLVYPRRNVHMILYGEIFNIRIVKSIFDAYMPFGFTPGLSELWRTNALRPATATATAEATAEAKNE